MKKNIGGVVLSTVLLISIDLLLGNALANLYINKIFYIVTEGPEIYDIIATVSMDIVPLLVAAAAGTAVCKAMCDRKGKRSFLGVSAIYFFLSGLLFALGSAKYNIHIYVISVIIAFAVYIIMVFLMHKVLFKVTSKKLF
ncbi:MAG: hypothetical protein ACOX4I_08470 [Anaerovoracaceae bacterium]|jgi:ATP-dependent protease ClpP protease subunit